MLVADVVVAKWFPLPARSPETPENDMTSTAKKLTGGIDHVTVNVTETAETLGPQAQLARFCPGIHEELIDCPAYPNTSQVQLVPSAAT
jgi:hypothetical protein